MCQNLLCGGLPGGCLGSKRGEEVSAAQNQVRGGLPGGHLDNSNAAQTLVIQKLPRVKPFH